MARMIDGVITIIRTDSKATTVKAEQRELVTCKHCKHRPTNPEEGTGFTLEFPKGSQCPFQGDMDPSIYHGDDWFCAAGESDGLDINREYVIPKIVMKERNKQFHHYQCPACGEEIVFEQKHCSECGRLIAWEKFEWKFEDGDSDADGATPISG